MGRAGKLHTKIRNENSNCSHEQLHFIIHVSLCVSLSVKCITFYILAVSNTYIAAPTA